MNSDERILTPVIAAALARRLRARAVGACMDGEGVRGAEKPAHNYLAQAPKNPCGARPGNRHAARHSMDRLIHRAWVRALLADSECLHLRLEAGFV